MTTVRDGSENEEGISEESDPLDHDLNLIKLRVNCSAEPDDFNSGEAFDRYHWLFVPKFEGTRRPVMSAHLFLPTDKTISGAHDKPLVFPWKLSIELHFAHFVQAVFDGATSFFAEDVKRTIYVMDVEQRTVAVDASIELLKALGEQGPRSIWPPEKDTSDSECGVEEEEDTSDSETRSPGIEGESLARQAETQVNNELMEVTISSEQWQQRLDELTSELEKVVDDSSSEGLVPETVQKIVFPQHKCYDCDQSIYETLYRSLDEEELSLCSNGTNCRIGVTRRIFIPIYDSPWVENVPTGKMIPRENVPDNESSTEESSSQQSERSEELELDAESSALDISERLSRESPVPTPFVYPDSLRDVENPQIRLLCLEPASSEEPISGNLETVTLSSIPPFEALSYCWGSMEPECYISINDCKLRVTPNLKLALYRLRDPKTSRRLWIDAICIAQTNSEEKSHQILLMRDIYFNARQTIVWLGEGGEQSHVALNMCDRLVSQYGNTFQKKEVGVDVEALYEAYVSGASETSSVSRTEADESAVINEFSKSFDLEKLSRETVSHILYPVASGDENHSDLDSTEEGEESETEEERDETESSGQINVEEEPGEGERDTDGDDETLLAGALHNGLDKMTIDERAEGVSLPPISRRRMIEQIIGNRHNAKDKSAAPPTGDEIAALHKLFKRPSFQRIWIIQEVALSREVLILCGSRTIDWDIFEFGYLIASRMHRATRMGSTTNKNIVYMS
ncbi:heterokaryon incompatibility protein-domain-containing protein [Xylariaceae sp. FL0255]|nr:heterokaryon incompatibility protein-domain-containing protein [Xylariaceae sp. FL0255]